MAQYGWADCPAAVHEAVESFVGAMEEQLGGNLVGVYLHGSLAMNCFNPDRSDIDLLIMTHEGMDVDTKRHVAEHLLQHSNAPFPIEISFMIWKELHPWRYPTPYDFHFSEDWRKLIAKDLADDRWKRWNEPTRHDWDLAAHFMITWLYGIALAGPPPRDVFPQVPEYDYLHSIWGDVEEAEQSIDNNVVYVTLNLCRVYAYVQDGFVCSKDEGGMWALPMVPRKYHKLLDQALEAYRGLRSDGDIDRRHAPAFARAILKKIERPRRW